MRLTPTSDLDLTFDIPTAGSQLQWMVFKNPVTGFEARWNGSSAVDDVYDIHPHTGIIVDPGDPSLGRPNGPFLSFLSRFVPSDPLFPWTTLGADEMSDNYPWSHTTGPGNRRYIAPALRYAVSTDPKKQAKGLAYLTSWAECQLARPLAHGFPFDCRPDQTINKGTPNEWNTDTRVPDPATGWNAYDVAHNDLSILAAGSALGLDVATMSLWLRLALVTAGHPPGSSFWWNQPRCVLWRVLATIWYGYGQFELGDPYLFQNFLKGHRAKKDLRGLIEQYMAFGFDPPTAGNPDPRVMTVLPDPVNGKVEIHGEYPWQKAMRTTAWGMALASGLVSEPLLSQIRPYAEAEVEKALLWYRGTGGMAWAASMHEFTATDADTALAAALDIRTAGGTKPLTGRPYEKHPIDADSFILREQPIPQDLGLHLLGLALILGPYSEPVETLLPKAGVPGKTSWQGNKPPYESRVLDPVYALRQAMEP